MKDTHFLYAVAVLAIIGISATFVGYATNTLPTHAPRHIATTTFTNANTTKTKEDCSCCQKDLAAFKKFMEMRKRRKANVLEKTDARDIVSKE